MEVRGLTHSWAQIGSINRVKTVWMQYISLVRLVQRILMATYVWVDWGIMLIGPMISGLRLQALWGSVFCVLEQDTLLQGWATYRSQMQLTEQSLCGPWYLQREKNNMVEYYVYLPRAAGVARNKHHNSFSTCGRKRVAHHCFNQNYSLDPGIWMGSSLDLGGMCLGLNNLFCKVMVTLSQQCAQ